ncbi:hypothetical protein EUX98_g9151 [Antrodiella citrinella]|uniref:Uncharacterized protein n=1 Tax=Antrodiella citrinella TaxID=2447956 RepID=A0A4S4LXI1_9APHY|nr:hypothetical protein EUX98_g9151 [Antrodiella citrinella]
MFDLQLQHVPGKDMIQSDTLSRLIHLNTEIVDNDAMTLLPDHLFHRSIDIILHDRIAACNDIDPVVRVALTALRDGTPPPLRTALSDWAVRDGLVSIATAAMSPLIKTSVATLSTITMTLDPPATPATTAP